MDVDSLKRKLRELKRLEDKIRFAHIPDTATKKYIWDEFFSTRHEDDLTVKYPISILLKFNNEALKKAFEDYFCSLYFRMYKDMGLNFNVVKDPGFTDYFGLDPGASVEEIKKKFRKLAKKYHPDHGGSNEKMIEVLAAYHRLLESSDGK
jgi:glyoxylase-like metal-dependent hydrolase (beta-lactamase superfamily II)